MWTGFKEVNTKFGHLTGDFVLAEIAGLLKSSVRGSDAVVRYGGDEFLLILADTSPAGAHKVIERTQAYTADWNRAGHLEKFQLSLSIGVAEWTDGKTLDECLDAADRHMYCPQKPNRRGRKWLQGPGRNCLQLVSVPCQDSSTSPFSPVRGGRPGS